MRLALVEATGRVDGIGPAESGLKRALDVAGALAVLLFFAPIGLVTILGIRLGRSGPILTREQTVGLRGRPFGLWRLARPLERETVFDRIARRAGLVRLPSVLNVIAGEMSLVGPAPHALNQSRRERRADYARRFEARPGLIWPRTPDGQVSLSVDLDYVSGWTVSRDLAVAGRYLADGLLNEPQGDG